MSLYIEWLNLIKEKSNESWLTGSQSKLYNLILNKWHSQPFINIYGNQGVGKTFLAHILAKEHSYFYAQDTKLIPPNLPQVILDDTKYDRNIRITAHNFAIGRIILISNRPVPEEAMPKLKLEINDHDLFHFQACLAKYSNITFIKTTPKGYSYTEMLLKEIIARGEN